MFKSSKIFAFVLLTAVFTLIAGCGTKPAEDTKVPVQQPDIGIIDMPKVIQNHPRYPELDKLQKQLATITSELEAAGTLTGGGQGLEQSAGMSDAAAQNFAKALEQEFQAKMTAKHNELKAQVESKVEVFRQTLADKLAISVQEMDRDYQPKIFNIQLKLRTLQLTKEQAEELQKELAKIQQERAARLSVIEQGLAKQLDAQVAAVQTAAGQELNSFSVQLNKELQAKGAAKKSETAAPGISGKEVSDKVAALNSRGNATQQEIAALRETIIKDIRAKAAQVAVEKGLHTVVIEVRANISALDVTDLVINRFKK